MFRRYGCCVQKGGVSQENEVVLLKLLNGGKEEDRQGGSGAQVGHGGAEG